MESSRDANGEDDKTSKLSSNTAGRTLKPKVTRKSKKTKNSKKPSDMPRRPLSAYNIFFKHTRGVILAEREDEDTPDDPDVPADSKGASLFAQLGRTIAKRWKELPDEEMATFKAKADEDMKRYRNEMEEYHLNVARKTRLETEARIKEEDAKQAAGAEGVSDNSFIASDLLRGIGGNNSLGQSQLDMIQQQQHNQQIHQLSRQNLLHQLSNGGSGLTGQSSIAGGESTLFDQMALQHAQIQRLQLQAQLQQQQQQQQHALQQGGLTNHELLLGIQQQQRNPLISQIMASQMADPFSTARSLGIGGSNALNSVLQNNMLQAALRGGGADNFASTRNLVQGQSSASTQGARPQDYQAALTNHAHLLQAASEQRELEQLLQQQRLALQAGIGGASVTASAEATTNDDGYKSEDSRG